MRDPGRSSASSSTRATAASSSRSSRSRRAGSSTPPASTAGPTSSRTCSRRSSPGCARIRQVYEPVAAAFFYAQSLRDSATVLVADFGGGTTDYSVIAFEKAREGLRAKALGHAGVGVAGDRFDYRIIDHVMLPQLGKGTTYRSVGKRLELPRSCFASFAHWHELSVMKTSRAFRELKEVAVYSDAPELVGRFIRLVESDQGYPLYKAVSDAKEALSSAEETLFSFDAAGFRIESVITRAQFESWIAPELESIEEALEEALANASIPHRDVDRVFLTGGSSLVPAVRRIFGRRSRSRPGDA